MCISFALAALGGMAAAKVLAPKPEMPAAPPAGPDPAVERAKAETQAAQNATSKLAARNRARAASSLLARPLDSTTSDVAALGGGQGKPTLGA